MRPRMGDTALSLPPNPDDLEIIRLDAKYVLVVEKDAISRGLTGRASGTVKSVYS